MHHGNRDHRTTRRTPLAAIVLLIIAAMMAGMAAVPSLPAIAGETNPTDDAIDFSSFIIAATVSTLNANGEWEPVTSVTEGDAIKVGIDYIIPANTVTGDRRTITYRLPEGIRPTADQRGDVDYNGTTIGTYHIGEDGVITIAFNDAFADGEDFGGTIMFQGAARLVDDADNGVIHFGDAIADVTVEPRRDDDVTDLAVTKTGTATRHDDHTAVIGYTVTASSDHGTGTNDVTLKDRLQSTDGTIHYDTDSIRIVAIDADGGRHELTSSDYTIDYEYTAVNGVIGPTGLTVGGLPALAVGGRYELIYDVIVDDVQPNGSFHVQNMGGADAGDRHPWAWHEEHLDRIIAKNGRYDADAGVIVWTVDIANTCTMEDGVQRCADLGGRTLTDVIGTPGVQAVASDTFAVTDADGRTIATGSTADLLNGGYTFPSGSTSRTYRIEYRTTAPAGEAGQTQQVSNTASFDGYEADHTVNVTERDWSVAKTYGEEKEREDGRFSGTWTTTVRIPASWDDLTVEDVIQPADKVPGGGIPVALCAGRRTRRGHPAPDACAIRRYDAGLRRTGRPGGHRRGLP